MSAILVPWNEEALTPVEPTHLADRESDDMLRWLWLTVALIPLVLIGCSSEDAAGDGSDQVTAESDVVVGADVEADAAVPGGFAAVPVPSVSGRIVTTDGEPVVGVKVLCCTMSVCYADETNDEGIYEVGDLSLGPWKLQLLGAAIDAATFVWWQDVTDAADHPANRDIFAVPMEGTAVSWPEDEGGTVVIADGELELSVLPIEGDEGPEAPLEGPIGWDDTIRAVKVPTDHLPPYDIEPWTSGDGTIAFHIDPFKLHGNVPVGLRLLGGDYGSAGDVYDLYSVNLDYATLDLVGQAVVAEDGNLVAADDANLIDLSTLVLVPGE